MTLSTIWGIKPQLKCTGRENSNVKADLEITMLSVLERGIRIVEVWGTNVRIE